MKNLPKILTILAISVTLTACGNNSETVTETSAKISETTTAETTVNTVAATETIMFTTEETTSFEELSDYDRAVRTAAEYIEEYGAEHLKYILYDFNFDGIPELMEETGFMDTIGWNVYKLTGSKVVHIGCMEFSASAERHTESGSDIIYYHGDELTLESGVHIYRDTEKDEIFYVTEYVTELHTAGHAAGMRYDVYADRFAERELYRCDFLTYDDCGASGNRYIIHNILDGGQASPMYRCDCNSEGFLYCKEFGEYLGNFEYLGMIDVQNYYSKKNGGSFYDYAETVSIPEKTGEERTFSGNGERVTVCGAEYYADAYAAEVFISDDNYDSIDLSELKLLPKLEKLTLMNRSDKIVDISEISDIETLTEVIFYGGDFDYSPIAGMENVIYTNAPDEYTLQMKSVKVVCFVPQNDDIDGYAPFYGMDRLEVVMYGYGTDDRTEILNAQLDRLAERRPDLLLIHVP
ncbi:MAG: hypothetical protein NC452_03740 [Eubacterium sp.]|nr:hypothetical protein [Eubacterium sp.]